MNEIDFAPLDGGTFRMGSEAPEVARYIDDFAYAFREFERHQVEQWFLKQVPSQTVQVGPFEMARRLITRGQFREFERAVFGQASDRCEGDEQLPIEGISYFEAKHFCDWVSRDTRTLIGLPTEAEWEYAASSGGLYKFPWGDSFDPKKANTVEAGLGRSSKSSEFEAGVSRQGIYDLAGNLEEWTDSFYLPYPGGVFIEDFISKEGGRSYPVLRGGSYRHHGDLCLATRRHGYRDNYAITGFRVVRRPASANQSQKAS